MKRILFIATFCCLAVAASQAQDTLRTWDRGSLTWDDFTMVDSSIGAEHSYLEFMLDIEERDYAVNSFVWPKPELLAVALMNKSLSWVDSNHRTPAELHYNQVLFNIVEFYRRRMQVAIDTGGLGCVDYYFRKLSYEVDSFCHSTRYGADTTCVNRWERNLKRQLDSIAPIMIEKHSINKDVREYRVIRLWEKGPLTWKNFTSVGESIGNEHSYIEFFLDIENRRQDIDGVTWPVMTAVAGMDKQLSWVDTNHRTPEELHYNQVLFNLVELYRRHLQVAIDTSDKSSPDSVFTKIKKEYMQYLTYEANYYCRSTRYGADTAAVNRWDYDVRLRMDSITPFMVEKHAPAFVLPNYSLPYCVGTNIGGGFKYFGGGMQPLFAPSGGVYWDLELGYGRHILTLGMYLGGGRCKLDTLRAVEDKNTLLGSDEILTMDLYANYGFAVVDSRSLRIMPFVGYGMQGLFYSDATNQTSGGPKEGCWRAGVDVKYHFTNEFTATRQKLEQYFGSMDAKVYVSRDKFNNLVGAPRGYTINVALGFSLLYRAGKARTHVN